MPDVGEGLTEAEILKWLVQVGDTVTDGQMVVEVETAKAAVELPIPYDGTVRELRFEEGATVDVGTPIIAIDTGPGDGPADGESGGTAEDGAAQGGAAEDGERREPVLVGYGVANGTPHRRRRKPAAGEAAAGEAAPAPAAPAPAPAAPAPAPAAPVPAPAARGRRVPESGGRPLAKPPVRKLAKDLGIDLSAVVPTGPGGIITREDVRGAAEAQAAPAPAPAPAEAPAPAPGKATAAGERRVPIRGVRKATAQAVTSSAFTAPHVTEFVTVDVTRTVRLVERLRKDPDLAGVRVTPLLLVAKALLLAVRRNPEINAAWDEENQEIVYKDAVNLGIAAATPRGLIVPNIKDAGAKSLPELARALGDLVTTAREGKTSPADMTGGTLTITNIGVFGIDAGTPILNPGESAILAFGAIKERPWVHKGKVKPRHVTTLALSFDHRLVDGELGSKVLADVAAVLERPKRLITWG
ncbi:dihydrolipoamide acetyltransferase family protein [Streptomyces sp. 7-21]|uniref:dihydrolipoamide acetyltransferase family protein n=1 Tax=Streptomyces sp. 7-21 TaxID=2802283 RepID=UPI00191F3424|nr:dihydrolipoamide acetyltransferase family protein [Streptomyces sp. 7-21]MBL1066039.1 2-oxo acid dehydrogenase subunit E2 [Streptomyces sp. 7-21]